MRILLVEDDNRIAKPLAEDLRHQHHVVELAKDGIEGWEAAQIVAYDLIIPKVRSRQRSLISQQSQTTECY